MSEANHSVKLLDCTLRDGGYVNDWEFGHSNLISIYERLVDSGVDMVELGFIDDRRPFDINRSIFPDTASIRKIWGSSKKRPPMVLGMIDYGTCDISHIEPQEISGIDGIRVIFKKHLMHEAMAYVAEIKKLGYKAFAQLVSVTSYTDEELMELIGLVNEVKPYAVSMVDTYGLLNPKDMLHIYDILDENVNPETSIGFHAHNNFQLAYANGIAFLEKDRKHDILIDGTIFGMGKSAGNAPLELLMMELNKNHGKSYDIDPILEATEESIMKFYKSSPWGYKTFFYLSALNRCHPTYVSDFQQKQNLSITHIDELLHTIGPEEKKLLYDRDVSKETYEKYREEKIVDDDTIAELSKELKDKAILIIGPGKNIQLQADKVHEYIKEKDPVTISINYLPEEFHIDYVYTTNRKRYQEMTDALHEEKNADVRIIATSNVDCIQDSHKVYHIERYPLLEMKEHIKDNSLLMLLKTIKRLGIKKIALAGFDGYADKEVNYFNPSMEYSLRADEMMRLNRQVKEVMATTLSDIEMEFVTYSHYTETEDGEDAAF